MLIDLHRSNLTEYKPLHRNKRNLTFKGLLGLDRIFRTKDLAICRVVNFNSDNRVNGKDWPAYADTMIGLKRLNNIQYCVEQILKDNIPGDLIETGVWRGGATIFMKALLNHYNNHDKVVWLADSFEGLPKPDEKKYIHDKGDRHYKREELSISLKQVRQNFEKYGLLDERVKFLKGWFKDTLPTAPIQQLSLLRLDGDMYESTMDALRNLYPKLVSGGYIIIDDWGAVKACQQAVLDYRAEFGINEPIETIDWSGVYWRKQ